MRRRARRGRLAGAAPAPKCALASLRPRSASASGAPPPPAPESRCTNAGPPAHCNSRARGLDDGASAWQLARPAEAVGHP